MPYKGENVDNECNIKDSQASKYRTPIEAQPLSRERQSTTIGVYPPKPDHSTRLGELNQQVGHGGCEIKSQGREGL